MSGTMLFTLSATMPAPMSATMPATMCNNMSAKNKMGGRSSKTTVAQKCSGAMEIQKYDGPTDGPGYWVDARDTCVFKNVWWWCWVYWGT